MYVFTDCMTNLIIKLPTIYECAIQEIQDVYNTSNNIDQSYLSKELCNCRQRIS